MLLLFLSFFFHYDLFHCDVFEKANFNSNGPLTTEHETTRNHNFMNCSITDIMWQSTPGTDQTNPITPHYSYLPTQTNHGTFIQSPTGPTPKGLSLTKRFPQAIRRHQKIHQKHQGITVLEISKRRNSKANASSYEPVRSREQALHRIKRSQSLSTGTKKRLFPNLLLMSGKGIIGDDTKTDDDDDDEFEKKITQMDVGEGILTTREIPEVTKKLWYSDRTKTSTATTTRQFLRSNTIAHSYFEMIESLHEGYMMVFLIELTRLIATKERKAVRDVVKHTDQIIQSLYQSGQLQFFGKPLMNVTSKVARLLKESKIDVIQNRAARLHHMLRQRHQELSVEVNTILEYADILYDDVEGRLLFEALKEFAAYPNISLTGYWLCKSLINNFLRPYRRLKDTQQRQELMESVNLEFRAHKKAPLRSVDVRQADDTPYDNQHQTEPVTQTEPHSDTTRSPREMKRKRYYRTRKRKRERNRHLKHRYRPENSQRYYQNHVLKSMTQTHADETRLKRK